MFRTRLITTTLLKHYYQLSLAQVGWRPCFGDIDCYLQLDPTGMYVGELNNKPIATYSVIKYADGYRHLGSIVCYVKEQYQNLGYGVNLAEACWAYSAPIKNMSGYATPEMARKYEKSDTMISRWSVISLDISKALDTLQAHNSDSCEVRHINEINMQDVCDYDADVFG